jgi:hypothetical protein
LLCHAGHIQVQHFPKVLCHVVQGMFDRLSIARSTNN